DNVFVRRRPIVVHHRVRIMVVTGAEHPPMATRTARCDHARCDPGRLAPGVHPAHRAAWPGAGRNRLSLCLMGTVLRGTAGNGARGGSDGVGAGREASPAPGVLDTAPGGPEAVPAHRRRGASARTAALVRDYLPRGNTLDEATFQRRHLLLCWILALHVPALFVLGLWLGFTPLQLSLELLFPAACVVFARMVTNRRLAAFFTTAGLVYCSSVLVHLSGGVIEAHFHFFILIRLLALYPDWVPFLWDVVFTILSHGIGSAIAPTMMFDHGPGQRHPWTWALIHGLAVLAACIGEIIFWKNTEDEQRRNVALVANLAAAETEKQ